MNKKPGDDIRKEMNKAFYTKEGLPIITKDIRERFTDEFEFYSELSPNSKDLADRLAEEIRKENSEYLIFVNDMVKLFPEEAQSAIRLTFLSPYRLFQMQAEYYRDIKGLEKEASHP